MRKFFVYMVFMLSLALFFSCGHDNALSSEVITETTEVTTTTTPTTTFKTMTTSTTTVTTTETTTETTTTEVTTVIVTEPVTEPAVVQTTVYIPVTEPMTEPVVVETEPVYTGTSPSTSDITLLAMLIHHEASTSYDGKLAVGNCVINRMNARGQTLSQVIYAPGQFSVASYMYTYNDLDYQVAEQVLTYGSTDTRIMYFDGNHGGLNWFYDSYHNYLYAA